ncbi:MAG: hypothetical protein A2365_03040 [Candidatus Nealsonbacteria bacterium RIFOXYB1_FULL_40_15]|uniref:V-type ATP synthase subunit F n=2 Tax=Candidatus Nealsoniibacteriota TaxID=1817911 RepID=A0A1G2ETY3_9BACT|nr:MAG: hypothetical protein A2365_03040 [Candidatus Nealsonbacteria bacterium RIFOXYB1_FULL_40_15]OGZ29203.1 MAG: hypothetical protein A2427_02895 [Candidatus Nealsonbacteria bacterium RIFOXYC1_FULL_40_7]OGZ29885.1 MAG: hypothetical protein A2562_02075 [Candidatus Nealsonbacteria bacterium RIFOXYD1_FULL_39_11]
MKKIGVIGEKKSILIFNSLGVDALGVDTEEEFRKIKSRLEEYAIIFITEDIQEKYQKEVEDLYSRTLPAVLIIPGAKKSSEAGKNSLKKIIERALGSELNI